MNSASRSKHVSDYLDRLRKVLAEVDPEAVARVMERFERAYERDHTVFICGNGGSAATASHWVCDFAKGTIHEDRRRLRMHSLGDNLATLTAYANDVNYDRVFAEPIKTFAREGDVVVLLTASGNSPNILEAASAARDQGAVSVGLIGFGGGKLADLVDEAIVVQSHEYGPVEDLHLILDHIISTYMRAFIARGK